MGYSATTNSRDYTIDAAAVWVSPQVDVWSRVARSVWRIGGELSLGGPRAPREYVRKADQGVLNSLPPGLPGGQV
jgi:hypothetical protein